MTEVSPLGDAGEVCLAGGDTRFGGEGWGSAVGGNNGRASAGNGPELRVWLLPAGPGRLSRFRTSTYEASLVPGPAWNGSRVEASGWTPSLAEGSFCLHCLMSHL